MLSEKSPISIRYNHQKQVSECSYHIGVGFPYLHGYRCLAIPSDKQLRLGSHLLFVVWLQKEIIMKKRCCLFLFFVLLSCYNIKAQKQYEVLRSAKYISIMIDEDDFHSNPVLNFFTGELCEYFKSLNIICRINKSLNDLEPCAKYIYVEPIFSGKANLDTRGVWQYYFYKTKLYYYTACPQEEDDNEYTIDLGNIVTKTSHGALKSIFKKKIGL